MEIVFHKEMLCAASFPVSPCSQGSWIKENSLFSFRFLAASPQKLCTTCADLCTSTAGSCALSCQRLICHCLRARSDSSVSTGSFPCSPGRVLPFTSSADVSQAAIAWFCAEFSAHCPFCSFAVLPVPLLQLSQEGEDICAPFLCLFMQHLLVWIEEPLANLFPHRSGFSFLLPDPDKAAPGEAAWLWCMKKKTNKQTWGLLLCFYNSFFVFTWPKNSSECFLTIHGNGYCKENSSKQGKAGSCNYVQQGVQLCFTQWSLSGVTTDGSSTFSRLFLLGCHHPHSILPFVSLALWELGRSGLPCCCKYSSCAVEQG